MDQWHKRIEDKLDLIAVDITDMKVVQAKQHVVLVNHESRSTKLEALVIPIHKKVLMVEGALKFIGILSVLAGIAEMILRLMGR